MGISTKGFIYGDNVKKFSWLGIVRYIDNKYDMTYIQPGERNHMTISFNDGEDSRILSVFGRYTSYVNEGYPVIENNTGSTAVSPSPYIILFDVNCWGNSDEIIKGIVKHFGGGYFIHDDCDEDWEIV